MLEIIKAIIFGIVEGITEWLPISSTGHMIILDDFIKLDCSEEFMEMFLVVIQLGAILAVVLLFWNKIFPFQFKDKRKPVIEADKIMLWCDTVGLGIFTVLGIQTASRLVTEDNPFFFIFIGVLTGVGGGVVRDIMAGETPYILVREIYASASIAGGIVYIACRNSVGEASGMLLGLCVTVVVRALATHFHWNLLRIH